MAVQLRLDAAALAALFPEGSEARVELQRAVVQEFLNRHINPKTLGAEAREVARGLQARILTAVLAEADIHQTGYGGAYLLGDAVKARIRQESFEYFDDTIRKEVRTEIDSWKTNIETMVKTRAETLIDDAVRRHVTANKDRVAAALDALKG